MKKFYLLRHEDVHGNSGTGVVAEGIIFDTGSVAMTWLSLITTVTIYKNIKDVMRLHSHEGRTEVVVEPAPRRRIAKEKFEQCAEKAHAKKLELRSKQ
jgi:hypothetical protein